MQVGWREPGSHQGATKEPLGSYVRGEGVTLRGKGIKDYKPVHMGGQQGDGMLSCLC